MFSMEAAGTEKTAVTNSDPTTKEELHLDAGQGPLSAGLL